MELLVAYQKDPAGSNIAKFISREMEKNDDIYKGKYFDLAIISSPTISADWLEEKFDYDGYIFYQNMLQNRAFWHSLVITQVIFLMQNLVVILDKFLFHIHVFKNHTFKVFGKREVNFHNFR